MKRCTNSQNCKVLQRDTVATHVCDELNTDTQEVLLRILVNPLYLPHLAPTVF